MRRYSPAVSAALGWMTMLFAGSRRTSKSTRVLVSTEQLTPDQRPYLARYAFPVVLLLAEPDQDDLLRASLRRADIDKYRPALL